MRYLLLSIGTRGDMEPFLAAGQLLEERGHEVHVAMPAQFAGLVADTRLVFHPLDRRFLSLIEGQTGRDIMGQKGNRWQRMINLLKLARSSFDIQENLVQEQHDYVEALQPDYLLYHPKCIYGRVWAMQQPQRAAIISPIPCWLHPVAAYPHIAISVNLGRRLNLASYRAINHLTARFSAKYAKPYRAAFPQLELSSRNILRFMRHEERTIYAISPSLFARPPEWPEQARVSGYLERRKTDHWEPEADLLDFVEAKFTEAAKPVFITFGSMVNADPEATVTMMVEVLRRLKIPAIINTSSGGLPALTAAPDHIYFVNNIPYEWIFPKVHGVVHHGGSGTTHTALNHGCASLIIPHIIDQFFWNKRVHELGAGPLGVKIKKLDGDRFEQLLRELLDQPAYKRRAEEISHAMRREAAEANFLDLVTLAESTGDLHA